MDREMDDEIALHIELHAEALERQGVPKAEAWRRARAEFGGIQRYREEGRDARALAWVHDAAADLRYGVRTLRRSPAFTTVSVLSLGLGIGANVAIFGLLYGVLMQPLAIAQAHELSAVIIQTKGEPYATVLHRTYLALREAPGVPELQASHEADDILAEAGEVREYSRANFVEGGYFAMLGVPPLFGRSITREDDEQHASVVVLSEDAWTHFFARGRSVLGRQLSLRSHPFTVIGVMPRSFRGIRFNGSFNMAVPASAASLLGIAEDRNYVNVVTRIGTSSLRAAYAPRIDAAFHRCCVDAEELSRDVHVTLADASRGVPYGKSDFRDDYRLMLWSLMGGALLVLLVACSNVGNLLLARGAARERELSIRLSIGASRWRIVRQLLAESALLAALGAILGIVLAAIVTRLLIGSLPTGFETAATLVEFDVKPAILTFTAAVAITCVLAFGVGPALRATRADLASSLKDRSASRARGMHIVDRLLVVGQVAVSLVLVCGAGLLIATLRNLRAIDPGFASTHLVAISVETRGTEYERGGIVPIYREILERARRVPGVLSAAMATRIPAIGGRDASFPYGVLGQLPHEPRQISLTVVTPGYLATSGTRLLQGRDFTDADTPTNRRVAIANEAFVARHFPVGSPIGAVVRIDELNGGETVTVIGVTRDVRFGDRRRSPEPMLFIPAAQAGKWPFLLLLMRTATEPKWVMPSVIREVGAFAQRLRITHSQTMDEAFDEVLLRERLAAALASSCAALALVLAMIGLTGLVGFSVARRTREIGVRMALGARRSGVVWLVLRDALGMVATGIVIGIPLALGTGHALRSLLYGIAPTNVVLLGITTAGLVAVAVLASAAPAWRASRVDPVIALRAD